MCQAYLCTLLFPALGCCMKFAHKSLVKLCIIKYRYIHYFKTKEGIPVTQSSSTHPEYNVFG